MNYLPSERDASFDRGKATEMISRSYGILGPMLATTFTIDGQTMQDDTVTLRDRDTATQRRVPIADVERIVREALKSQCV